MNPTISVVIASRNRAASVARLVEQLGAQALEPSAFEIIVVDDGSDQPVADGLAGVAVAPALATVRIPWSGQSTARNAGATPARGEILVFLDDDMQIGPEFLQRVLARHEETPRAVVLGNILGDPDLAGMPLFERYHARQMERWRRDVMSGRTSPEGSNLCTGNVSVTRADFMLVGGFDTSLRWAEDRELGINLQKHGCPIVYADDVRSVHSSDHARVGGWLRRAHIYGGLDLRIAAKHADVPKAHPWRFWALIHPLSRPIVALSLLWPLAGRALGRVCYGAGVSADALRMTRVALTLVAFTYALEYFAGLRAACGSFAAFRREVRRARPARRGVVAEFGALCAAIRADHAASLALRRKYKGEDTARASLLKDLVTKIGSQMMFWYRVMRFFDACRVPVLPMIVSRLMRHAYGADIHWKARIEPGVCVVHGIGLILSGKAQVGPGCILFQNVTLGESIDPFSGEIGAPQLERNVHVAPGATLLGPIVVGEGSKVGAGAVLARTVPAHSLVVQAEASVTSRGQVRPRGVRPAANAA